MSDELKHECGVAMVVLRRPPSATGDFGGTKLSLLMEKQHNRGQDGAGAAILAANPEPGEKPFWIAKSASSTPLADVLAAIGRRNGSSTGLSGSGDSRNPVNPVEEKSSERVFLGHLRYATFGKGDENYCHPFVHEASELASTLLLAGNFNLTNTAELFENYRRQGEFPTSRSDGYLICEMIAHELATRDACLRQDSQDLESRHPGNPVNSAKISGALSSALAEADGAWTLCGATGDGWAFATRDPHGIRPGWYYVSDDVVAVASERPAIQAAFDVPPEAVKELPPGEALIVSPNGEVQMAELSSAIKATPCAFERIYFSRANDADIHRERKALGAALLPQILQAADAPLEDIFFSYIPNSAQVAFHGLLEELFQKVFSTGLTQLTGFTDTNNPVNPVNPVRKLPRFGQVAVKDAKFRTFIADAAARREFYKHVYDVTYGLVRPGIDTLVVLDDSIVRGNTMKNAILPMLDRLGPKRIVVASSAPPIRYPDCYGIDMSTLGELVAFRALVNLLGDSAKKELRKCIPSNSSLVTAAQPRSSLVTRHSSLRRSRTRHSSLPSLYARFTEEQHCDEIARLLTPPGMKAEVKVVYQTVDNLRKCLGASLVTRHSSPVTAAQPPSPLVTRHSSLVTDDPPAAIGDWYFTGDYPTPGGYRVLARALENYLEGKSERSY